MPSLQQLRLAVTRICLSGTARRASRDRKSARENWRLSMPHKMREGENLDCRQSRPPQGKRGQSRCWNRRRDREWTDVDNTQKQGRGFGVPLHKMQEPGMTNRRKARLAVTQPLRRSRVRPLGLVRTIEEVKLRFLRRRQSRNSK